MSLFARSLCAEVMSVSARIVCPHGHMNVLAFTQPLLRPNNYQPGSLPPLVPSQDQPWSSVYLYTAVTARALTVGVLLRDWLCTGKWSVRGLLEVMRVASCVVWPFGACIEVGWGEWSDSEPLIECWDVFMFDIFRIFIMSPLVYA